MDKEKLWILCENLADVEHQIEDMGFALQRLSHQLDNIKRGIIEVLSDDTETFDDVVEKTKSCKTPKSKSLSSKDTHIAELTPQLPITEQPDTTDKNSEVSNIDVTPNLTALPTQEPQPEIGSHEQAYTAEPVIADVAVSENEHSPELSDSDETSTLVNSVLDVTLQSRPKPQQPRSNIPMPMGIPREVRFCSMVISNEFEFSDTEFSKSNRSIYVIEVMTETLARFYPIADKAKHLIMKRVELLDPVCIADIELTPEDLNITEENYGILQRNSYDRWNIVKRCSLLH